MDKKTFKDLIKKLRRYEVKVRNAITNQMQGDFHSVFKGSGITFDDLRVYQYGDDVRNIDWNASAKGHDVYIKTYREEREQMVYLILDVSASQEIGERGRQKVDIGKEICGVLALSAVKETSQVGLLCYSDQKELFTKPGKGIAHAYNLIASMYDLKPASLKTNLNGAMSYFMNIVKRRGIVILVSDFIDTGYHRNLRSLAGKHDLVVIHLHDKRESALPSLGIIPVEDKESRKTVWVNSSSMIFRNQVNNVYQQNVELLETFCRQRGASYLNVDTREDFVPKLVDLFKFRNKTRKPRAR
jgi:uncharacterized protein (DUF58 family)